MVYGPVPTGSVASLSTWSGCIMAPMRVPMDHSHWLEGRERVTSRVSGSMTRTWSTTSMPFFMPLVHASLTRVMEKAAVSAVKGSPVEKVTPSRRWKVYTVPSGETSQLVASPGVMSPLLSMLMSVSYTLRMSTEGIAAPPVVVKSRLAGGPEVPTTMESTCWFVAVGVAV